MSALRSRRATTRDGVDAGAVTQPGRFDRARGGATVTVDDQTHFVAEREYSPWVRLSYKAAINIKMSGIVRFYVTRLDGDFGMYMTPIHIDPAKPVMPIS